MRQRLTSVLGMVIFIFAMPPGVFATSSADGVSPNSNAAVWEAKAVKSSEQATPGYNYSHGPLRLTSQSPGQSLRLTMPPMVPEAIEPGHYRLLFGTAWTNVWAKEDRYFLDYEMLDSFVAVSYGVNDRLGLALGFNQRNYFGGAMDNSIEEFHDLFGIHQKGRDEAPHNDTRIIRYDEFGNIIEDTNDISEANNNNILFAAQFILGHGTERMPAMSVTGIARYGLDTPPSENDDKPIDIGMGIGFSKRWAARWYSYHYLSLTRYGQTELFNLELEKTAASGMTAVAWLWRPNCSILLQYMVHEGVLKDFGSMSNTAHELDLGLKWQFSDGSIMEIGFIENI